MGHFFTQFCHLVAKYTKVALRHFLAHSSRYATLKSVSSHRQNSDLRGIQIEMFVENFNTKTRIL